MRGVSARGDVGRVERAQKGQQRLDVSVAEARADVAGPVEPVRLPHAEDERAEASARRPVPARNPTIGKSASA